MYFVLQSLPRFCHTRIAGRVFVMLRLSGYHVTLNCPESYKTNLPCCSGRDVKISFQTGTKFEIPGIFCMGFNAGPRGVR